MSCCNYQILLLSLLKEIIKNMEDKKTNQEVTVYTELVMEYSPILGTTYKLKPFEWDEDHAFSLVLNGILNELDIDELK